jgi:hypothetical protein
MTGFVGLRLPPLAGIGNPDLAPPRRADCSQIILLPPNPAYLSLRFLRRFEASDKMQVAGS